MKTKILFSTVLFSLALSVSACEKMNRSAGPQLQDKLVGSGWMFDCKDNANGSSQNVKVYDANGDVRSYDYNYAVHGCAGATTSVTSHDTYKYSVKGRASGGTIHVVAAAQDPSEGDTETEFIATVQGDRLRMMCHTVKNTRERNTACDNHEISAATRVNATEFSD